MAETFPSSSSDTLAAKSVGEACPGALYPLWLVWRRIQSIVGSRTVSLLLRLSLLLLLLLHLYSSPQVLMFLPGRVIKSTAKDTCCGHSVTAICTIYPRMAEEPRGNMTPKTKQQLLRG